MYQATSSNNLTWTPVECLMSLLPLLKRFVESANACSICLFLIYPVHWSKVWLVCIFWLVSNVLEGYKCFPTPHRERFTSLMSVSFLPMMYLTGNCPYMILGAGRRERENWCYFDKKIFKTRFLYVSLLSYQKF